MENITCPYCNSVKLLKDGNKNGKQRYECKECKRKFTHGIYIKKEIKKPQKSATSKKAQLAEKNIPQTLSGDEKIINELSKIIEIDVTNNNLDYEKYKKIITSNNSNISNYIARKLSSIEFDVISDFADKYLFKTDEEDIDSFIIKLLIFSSTTGISKLLNILYKFNKYNLSSHIMNSIGKYLCEDPKNSWAIVYPYFYKELSNINFVKALTRYISYLKYQDKEQLKMNVPFADIKNIYLNNKILNAFKVEVIDDSKYSDNYIEFTISLKKILSILSEADLIGSNYRKQYEDSIFTDDRIVDTIEYIYIQYNYFDKSTEEITEIYQNITKHNPVLPDSPLPKVLSDKGLKVLGKDFINFYNEIQHIRFIKTNLDFEIWLDNFSNYVYNLIIKYGLEEYRSFFCNGYSNDLIFRSIIRTKRTEENALYLCNEYMKEYSLSKDDILKEIFCKLLECRNKIALNTLYNWIKDKEYDISERNSKENVLLQNYSFWFINGLYNKIYGSYSNRTLDYSSIRKNTGLQWETIVGLILKENYDNIIHHQVLSNNTIPDYVLIKNGIIDTIFECKLTLDDLNYIDAIRKYYKYSKKLIFICNGFFINLSQLEQSSQYLALKKYFPPDFEISILDRDMLYNLTSNYKQTLDDFQNNKVKYDKYRLLKKRIYLTFSKEEADYLNNIFELTYKRSGL